METPSLDDSASILVLCMQARAFSEVIAHLRLEANEVLNGIEKTVDLMSKSPNARMRTVVPDMRLAIDEARAEIAALQADLGNDMLAYHEENDREAP